MDSQDGSFTCPGISKDESYCAGESLSSNIIIRCDAGKGYAGNCNDDLTGVDPPGVKAEALCYQSSSTTGDAACSYGGLVYPLNRSAPYRIPSSSLSMNVTYPSVATPGVHVRPSASLTRLHNATRSSRAPTTATARPVAFRGTATPCTTSGAAATQRPHSTGTGPNHEAAKPTAGPTASGGTGVSSSEAAAPYPTSTAVASSLATAGSPPAPTASPTTYMGAAERNAQMAGSLFVVALVFCVLG